MDAKNAIAFYGTFKCTFVEEGTSQLVVADATDRCYDSEQLFMNHGHVSLLPCMITQFVYTPPQQFIVNTH